MESNLERSISPSFVILERDAVLSSPSQSFLSEGVSSDVQDMIAALKTISAIFDAACDVVEKSIVGLPPVPYHMILNTEASSQGDYNYILQEYYRIIQEKQMTDMKMHGYAIQMEQERKKYEAQIENLQQEHETKRKEMCVHIGQLFGQSKPENVTNEAEIYKWMESILKQFAGKFVAKDKESQDRRGLMRVEVDMESEINSMKAALAEKEKLISELTSQLKASQSECAALTEKCQQLNSIKTELENHLEMQSAELQQCRKYKDDIRTQLLEFVSHPDDSEKQEDFLEAYDYGQMTLEALPTRMQNFLNTHPLPTSSDFYCPVCDQQFHKLRELFLHFDSSECFS